jgi:hypothetical protein
MTLPAAAQREWEILALWDRGAGRERRRRDEALFAAAEVPPTASIGAGNAALLALRTRLFGAAWRLRARCPACQSDCEFQADSAALATELVAPAATAPPEIKHLGDEVTLRVPTLADLQAIASLADTAHAADVLLARCLGCARLPALDPRTLAAIEAELERRDPGAIVAFALDCPDCGHAWSAVIDIGPALWAEVQSAAERALLEVDALAREYGWSESEVLALSPTRRAAYLQLAGTS